MSRGAGLWRQPQGIGGVTPCATPRGLPRFQRSQFRPQLADRPHWTVRLIHRRPAVRPSARLAYRLRALHGDSRSISHPSTKTEHAQAR